MSNRRVGGRFGEAGRGPRALRLGWLLVLSAGVAGCATRGDMESLMAEHQEIRQRQDDLNARMDQLIDIMTNQSGAARDAAIREALRIYREDIPHIPLHHQMIPWAMRSNLTIPHMANNQPYFRWARMN